MARVAGVNIPDRKHTVIALQQIYGIGGTLARKICEETNVTEHVMVKEDRKSTRLNSSPDQNSYAVFCL